MPKPDIAIFDTETTGLTLHPAADIDKQPKIIEFGCAVLSGATGEVVETLNVLIHPGEEVTDEITKITGITNADLEGQLSFAEVYPKIKAIIGRCGGLAAHNLPFDRALLQFELLRINENDEFPWPQVQTCTVGLYKEFWGRNMKLTELYEHVMGHKLEQTHRALDDVMAMVEIIQKEKLWRFLS